MAKLTKAQQAEKDEAVEKLREIFPPGSKVTTLLRHVSRSGMQRVIAVVRCSEEGPEDVSWLVARALGTRWDSTRCGVVVGGCGMDMGFHVVYRLSAILWPEYECLTNPGARGGRCPSNHHTNYRTGDRIEVVHHDGYALHQRWI